MRSHYGCENVHDWYGVVVGSGFQSGPGSGQNLWSNGPICFEELLHEDVGDWTSKEAGVIVDEVGKAVWIDSSVDLLDDCAFGLIAHLERFRVVDMEISGGGDLRCCSACQIWKNRILWSNEGDAGGDAVVGVVAAD